MKKVLSQKGGLPLTKVFAASFLQCSVSHCVNGHIGNLAQIVFGLPPAAKLTNLFAVLDADGRFVGIFAEHLAVRNILSLQERTPLFSAP